MPYVPDANNTSEPTSGRPAGSAAAEFRAIKQKIASIVAGAVITTAAGANAADITTFIQPDINDRPAMVAGGWLPWNLNQQWGGAGCTPFHMVDSATGVEYKFDAFDAYIDSDTDAFVGDVAGRFYEYQVIIPAKNLSLQAIWAKFYKILNPVDNLTLKLWSVAAGVPNALIATANVINGKQITSDSGGQWYRFSFAAVQALVAGTQYIITAEKSGGVDAANYYAWKNKLVTKYPSNLAGTGTNAPVWTAGNVQSRIFIAEAQASDQPIQSAGTFAGRIIGSEGNPINRSVGWVKPLREFFPLFNNNGWSILLRGKSWTKDKTIFDAIYGLHHDRINVRCNTATGFTCVTIYENDGTVNAVTGTSDVSSNSYKDILIVGRSMGDGGDYCKIYVGIGGVWTKEAEAITQTYTLDPLMLKQGHAWLMGGFQLFSSATYTKLSDMTILPSADGWTFTTTTATAEGSVFAVSAGKLYQIKAGMAAGGDGFYRKDAAGFSNANGWLSVAKCRITSNTNTKDSGGSNIRIQDGTKDMVVITQEFYIEPSASGVSSQLLQTDLKSNDNTFILTGKGSDFFAFVSGKLFSDYTGGSTAATANNRIDFGDTNIAANENADVVYDYVGYYSTANIYPQFTSGELHEFAVFSGDKNLLGQALYNAGVPISMKQYCGITRNYIGESQFQRYSAQGITANPTTASATPVVEAEMECFCIGSKLRQTFGAVNSDATATQNSGLTVRIDGRIGYRTSKINYIAANGTGTVAHIDHIDDTLYFGLHKSEGHFYSVNGATVTGDYGNANRELITEVRV